MQDYGSGGWGSNPLMAHVRSDFTLRICRSALPPIPAMSRPPRHWSAAQHHGPLPPPGHGSTSRAGSDELLFRMIPDLDLLDRQLANTDPDWIAITLRGIGECAAPPSPRR
jgi:hypothetical protein